jgi:O-antigen ligase
MQNKIKLFIYTSIGISLPFLIRTTLGQYNIRSISSPYATIYLHSLDIIFLIAMLVFYWKTKNLPFSDIKNVDKLWITLFSLIFLCLFWVKYPILTWVFGMRFYLGLSLIWYISRFQYLARDLKYVINGLFIGMLSQSIIVIAQFGLQQNLGLPFVVEPALSNSIAGVAKVDIFNNTFIRGYGTFPHPNILGYVGILALILLYAKKLGRKLSIIIYSATIIIAGFIDHYILTSIQAFGISILTATYLLYVRLDGFGKVFSKFIILITHLLILLSFSKTAIALLLALDLVYLTRLTQKSMFHVEQFQRILKSLPRFFVNAMSVSGIIFLWMIPYSQIIDTITKRFLYVQDAFQMIRSNLWFGVGLGQYVINLSDNRELWQYEPVHNILLLLWSELGLTGLSLIIVILCVECYTYIYGYKKQR